MINFDALIKGMIFGFIISSPILVANYFLNKRLDKMIEKIYKDMEKLVK